MVLLGALVAGLVVLRALTTFNATALAAPLACVFWLICWLTWRDPGASRTVVWTGLILMMASLLLHKVGLAADSSTASDYTWAYQILTVVKHGCELAGWGLVATGIIAGTVERAVSEVAARESMRLETICRPVTSGCGLTAGRQKPAMLRPLIRVEAMRTGENDV